MAVPIEPQAKNIIDPAHDVYRYTPRSLQPIFSPKTVAVIGATEKVGSVGRTVIWNLISSPFGGTVFPVNPKRANILGIKAYPSIRDLPTRRPGGDRHARPHCPGDHRGMRGSRREGSHCHLGGFQGDRTGRRGAGDCRFWNKPGGDRCASSAPTAWG